MTGAGSERRWDVGMVLGAKYALLRLLGEGGMAAVFEAQNSWTGRRVAVKLLDARYAEHPSVVQRFLQEARITAGVEHPGVVPVYNLERHHDPVVHGARLAAARRPGQPAGAPRHAAAGDQPARHARRRPYRNGSSRASLGELPMLQSVGPYDRN